MKQICENFQTVRKPVGRKAGLSFNATGIYLFVMMTLMATVLESLNLNVQTVSLFPAKNLKVLQIPRSFMKLRAKRETLTNKQQQDEANDYYDDNYDVLPDLAAADSQPPSLGDQIAEKAKQVAESLKEMWQSVTDTVRHCVDALRGMFGEPLVAEELTPEQEQEILANLETKYRWQQEHVNEI